MSALPTVTRTRTQGIALYAQEQWTRGRFTLQGGLRFDRAWSYFPEQQIGPQPFIPAPFIFPAQDGVTGFNDLSPRGGVVYDLFGNAKTAVKMTVGRYTCRICRHFFDKALPVLNKDLRIERQVFHRKKCF